MFGSYEYFKGLSALMKQVEESEKNVRKLANHDYLTGVATRRLADEQLKIAMSSAKRKNTSMAILFIDLDDFKIINDKHGHDAGDAVLKNVANILTNSVRASDVVARIGGDEFMLIISEPVDKENLQLFCKRLITQISLPIQHLGCSLSVGVSIGVSLFPDNAHDIRSMRKKADYAMYRAKNRGKNQFCFSE